MLLNNNSTYFNDEQAPPSKKQKLNISIGNYIEAIEETKSFLWYTLKYLMRNSKTYVRIYF